MARGAGDEPPPSPSRSATASPTFHDLRQLGCRELKRRCAEAGADTSRCIEKADFLGALAEALGLLRAASIERFARNREAAGPDAPLIFLDVDGVLNGRGAYPAVRLDAACLGRLVGLARDVDARLVLSSTWRLDDVLKVELAEALRLAGGAADLIAGQTPDIGTDRRGEEIQAWLSSRYRSGAPPPFVVLDDIPIAGVPEGRGIWTDPNIGLREADVAAARTHLLRKPLSLGDWMRT